MLRFYFAVKHRRSQGEAQGARPFPPIEIPPMTKILLFLQFQFLLASSRATVHAYNSN